MLFTSLTSAQGPNMLLLALGAGVLSAVLWIMFWLRETRERPRRPKTVFAAFLLGAAAIIPAFVAEHFLGLSALSSGHLLFASSAIEELLKFGAFFVVLRFSSAVRDPIDYPVYLMVAALGFAGMENAFYFLEPLRASAPIALVLSGSMRFLGTTLMQAAASSLAGIALGLAFFGSRARKVAAAVFGLALAVAVHGLFDLFIPAHPNTVFFVVVVSLWLLTIVIMAFLEHLRKKGSAEHKKEQRLLPIAKMEAPFDRLLAHAGLWQSDPDPIVAGLMKRGFGPDAPEHAALERILANVRTRYIAHLEREGTERDVAEKVARSLIRDTISPKSLAVIFAELKESESTASKR